MENSGERYIKIGSSGGSYSLTFIQRTDSNTVSIDWASQNYLSSTRCHNTRTETWPSDEFATWEDFLAHASAVASAKGVLLGQQTPDNNGLFFHKNPASMFEIYALDELTDETTKIINSLAAHAMRDQITLPALKKYIQNEDSTLLVARIKDEQATMIGFCALEIITDFPDKRILRVTPHVGSDYREHHIGHQLLTAINQWANTQNVAVMVTELATAKIPLLS